MLERNVSFFGRIDRARVILRRDRKSSSKSAVKLLGVTNGHRGIFIVRENQFRRTGVDSKPVSRTLAVFHYPLVMTVVPCRTVITGPILDNTMGKIVF